MIAILTTSSLAAIRTVTHYSSIENQTVDWPSNQKHTLDYFDPDKGRLIRIDFAATLNGSMYGKIENRNINASVERAFFSDITNLSVKMINGNFLDLNISLRVPKSGFKKLENHTLPLWSGNDTLVGSDYEDTQKSIVYTSASDLAGYIGTGTFDLPATAIADTLTGGGGVMVSNISTYGWSNATITYTYDDSRCLSGYKIDGCTGLPLSGWTIAVNNSTKSWTNTTNANGFWQVCNLDNGTYTVCEVLQPGWTQTSPDGCHTKIISGANITNINFTNQKLYCISGYKADACTKATLPGWNITLTNATHTVSQLTGPDGKYEFCNLKPGDYTIAEEVRSGYGAITTVSNPVNLSCKNITDQNFTNQKLLCINGTKYNDCTGAGLEGWTINLTDESGVVTSITTDADGKYSFCGLESGNYTVCEVLQAGWKNVTPVCVPVKLVCDNLDDVDFHNVPLLCINGTKIDDCTGKPLAGWTINLQNASGSVIATATTDSAGKYSFCGLESGSYTVCEVLKTGWKNVTPVCVTVPLRCENIDDVDFHNVPLLCINGTKIDASTGELLDGWTIILQDSNGTEITRKDTAAGGLYSFCGLEPGDYIVCEELEDGWKNITPLCVPVSLDCEDEVVDFENTPASLCINGTKFNNCTGDPLPGWTINLRDRLGNVIKTTTTDANGDYSFCGLMPGDYTVCEILQGGWKNVTPLCLAVTLADSLNSENNDFANDPPICINGTKINDCTDEGIAGWRITLFDANGKNLGTATTDANGKYSFCGLTPGIYYVCEEERAGWKAVRDEHGTIIVSGSSGAISEAICPWCDDNCVCVRVDCEGAEVDFRNIQESLCINGSKINNCTGAGIAGWGIYLYDATGKNIRTVQTDSRGRYSFCGLPPGQYRVCEEIRDGWVPVTYINHSSESCLPEQCTCDVCNNCISVILDCENSEENDFENIPPLSIKGKVIDDCTGLGLNGWTVKLYDDKGTKLTEQKTRTLNGVPGSYAFTSSTTGGLKLTASTLYWVCEVVQDGYTPVTYHANNTSPAMSPEYCIPIFLDCGETEVDDFENIPPMLISGHEFNHCTGEGLDGWTIHLKNGAGIILDTTTTDSTGYYEFSGLNPGWYTVCEDSIPEGWTSFREDPNSPAMALPGTSAAPEDCETPKCIVVNLDYCTDATDTDFENIPTFCIKGIVYNNSTEVAGFPVKIENSDGTQILSVPTDAYGEYSFCDLKAGTYTVCVDKPGWTADEPCAIVYLDCMDEEHDFDVYMGRDYLVPGITQPAITLDESRGAVVPGSGEPTKAIEPDLGGDDPIRPAGF